MLAVTFYSYFPSSHHQYLSFLVFLLLMRRLMLCEIQRPEGEVGSRGAGDRTTVSWIFVFASLG